MKSFDAAAHPLDGTHLIEASAGTGKTYSITFLVLRLLVEKGVSIDEVLVVTFTEAATRELKNGIYQRLGDALQYLVEFDKQNEIQGDSPYRTIFEKIDRSVSIQRLEHSLLNFDRAKIFTIHGFCQRLLTENAFETQMEFDLELKTDSSAFFSTLAKDFWLAFCYERSQLMISFFHQQGLNVTFFESLARLVYSKPTLTFVTNKKEENAEASYERSYEKARMAFYECKQDLKNIFEEATGINKRSYSRRNVPTWLRKTEAYFSQETPPHVLIAEDVVFRFSRKAILEGSKEGACIDDCLFFRRVEELGNALDGLHREVEETRRIFIEYVKVAIPKRKQKEGLLFFDDLLQDVYRNLYGKGAPALIKTITKNYKAALIDEFQDTDAIQFQIFKRIFIDSGIPFFMIGDPKQAVYSFRGGDIFAYMKAAKGLSEQTVSLDTNWRSAEDLVFAVNRLFSLNNNPFLYEEIAFHRVSAKPNGKNSYRMGDSPSLGFQFLFCKRTPNNCSVKKDGQLGHIPLGTGLHVDVACDEIVALLEEPHFIDDQRILPNDIAVLVRTNTQARQIRDELLNRGVVGTTGWGESVFHSVAAKELFQILYAIMDGSIGYVKTALSTIAFGIPASQLRHRGEQAVQLDQWQSFFLQLQENLSHHGIVYMVNKLLVQEVVPGDGGLKARVLRNGGGDRYLVDFLHLLELLQEMFSSCIVPLPQLVEQFELQMQDETVDERTGIRAANDEAAVQIVTIHKSKGLQYPVVVLPYAFNDNLGNKDSICLYHDPEKENDDVCDLRVGPPSRCIALQQKEAQSERNRLLYVALTRAKNVCKVVWGAFSDFHKSSLAYLLHGDDVDEVREMDDDAIERDLLAYCNNNVNPFAEVKPCTIERRRLSTDSSVTTLPQLKRRKFENTTFNLFRGMSFSSLIFQESIVSEKYGENSSAQSVALAQRSNSTVGTTVEPVRNDPFFELSSSFDRGTNFGNFVHDVLEQYFSRPDTKEDFVGVVEFALEKYGFQDRQWAKDAIRWFNSLLGCPLDSQTMLSLKKITGVSIPELEFFMPVSHTSNFSATALARGMAIEADSSFLEYAHGLENLHFSQFFGYIKGFVDLIFEYSGRYYIVDYKSNFLGDHQDAYCPAGLAASMAHHHYYLQYHIYTVALHRYLQRVVSGYQYDSHFGGVYYLFVRGMSPVNNSDLGIFYDKPPVSRIEYLDGLLKGLEGGASC